MSNDAIELLRNDGALLNAFGAMVGNSATGLGQSGRDKYLANSISTIVATMSRAETHALFRNSTICRKVVELLPIAATSKNWCELTIGKGRKGLPQKIYKQAEELHLRDRIREAAILGRLDGDGFLILGIDDGQTPDQPINEANIRQISWIESVTRYQLTPQTNTGKPGNPELYQLSLPQNQALGGELAIGRIHRSRILRIPGKKLYGDMINDNAGYNDSVLLSFYQSFIRYLLSLEYSVRMVQDYDTWVYKLKGLGSLILQGKEEDVLKRFRAILLSKSVLGGIAMDGDAEDGSYVSRNFSGVDALIDRFKDDVAACAEMPPTKLWGSSQKSALSNSSEGDKYAWSDCVEDYQSEVLDAPAIEAFRLLMLAKNSPTGGRVPEMWSLKYKSVLKLTLKEQVELRAKQTKEVDLPSIAAGTLSQEEVRQSAWGGTEFTIERQLLSNELPTPPRMQRQQPSQPTEPQPKQDAIEDVPNFRKATGSKNCENCRMSYSARPDGSGWLACDRYDIEVSRAKVCDAWQSDDQRTDDSTPAKRIINFQGFKLGLQYLPFDQRHGRMLPVAYGHIRGTKGADGMAVDCYVGSNLTSTKAYAIAQVINGKFDEEKLMLGFDSSEQAEQIYKQVMPPEFFGGIREIKVSDLTQYRKDAGDTLKIEGEVLSESEFEDLASVDRSDIETALNDWRSSAPNRFKTLLDSSEQG